MKTNPRTIKILLIIVIAFMNHESFAISATIRISQVYGGGGNTGAIYQNDFVELFNASSSPVNITGWSIQYAASTSATWHATTLSGTMNAGSYYLIQFYSEGAIGMTLPTSDAIGTTNLSSTDGKIALVNNATALSIDCPSDNSIIDLVGYGTTADCYEGSGAAPTPSNTEGDLRASNGCTDTDDNSSDFAVGNPTPRNSASSSNLCTFTGIADLVNHPTIHIWSSQDKLNIDFTDTKVVNAKIDIYNMLGQLLSREIFNGSGIYSKEISSVQSAFVIVRITNEEDVIIKKLVIINQ